MSEHANCDGGVQRDHYIFYNICPPYKETYILHSFGTKYLLVPSTSLSLVGSVSGSHHFSY